MMRTRQPAALLAVPVLVLSLATGCSDDSSEVSEDTSTSTTPTTAAVETTTAVETVPPTTAVESTAPSTAEPTIVTAPVNSSTTAPRPIGGQGSGMTDDEAEAANQQLVDQLEDCSTTASGCEGDDLKFVSAPEADLTGRDFSGANLQGADFSGANLQGADFTGSDLSGAVLIRADLTGATLTGAVLEGAVLTGAQLDPGALDGTLLCGTIMPDNSINESMC